MSKLDEDDAITEPNVYELARTLSDKQDVTFYSGAAAAFMTMRTIPAVQELRRQGKLNRAQGLALADLDPKTQELIVNFSDPGLALKVVEQEKLRQKARFVLSFPIDLQALIIMNLMPKRLNKEFRAILQNSNEETKVRAINLCLEQFRKILLDAANLMET